MVDHWISSQRSESGTSSPVRDAESSPSPNKKKLTIQTVVPDKPEPTKTQKTLSERYVSPWGGKTVSTCSCLCYMRDSGATKTQAGVKVTSKPPAEHAMQGLGKERIIQNKLFSLFCLSLC